MEKVLVTVWESSTRKRDPEREMASVEGSTEVALMCHRSVPHASEKSPFKKFINVAFEYQAVTKIFCNCID